MCLRVMDFVLVNCPVISAFLYAIGSLVFFHYFELLE